MLVCRRCKSQKPQSDFYFFENTGRHSSNCKPCSIAYAKSWAGRNRDRVRVTHRAFERKRGVRPWSEWVATPRPRRTHCSVCGIDLATVRRVQGCCGPCNNEKLYAARRGKVRVKRKDTFAGPPLPTLAQIIALWPLEVMILTVLHAAVRKREANDSHRRYAANHPEYRRAKGIKRRAREKNAPGRHSGRDIKALYAAQGALCPYCRADLSLGYHVDHVLPLALGGSNYPENLQLLCPDCNIRKGAQHPDEFHLNSN